jgi:hypothetical protein
MSDQTVEAPPPIQVPAISPRRPDGPRRTEAIDGAAVVPWVLGGLALLAFSLLVLLWARTRPGYDPYGWLVWGKLSLHLNLDTNGAPSWKPLPFLFTVPYALFGRYQLWLWMVTAVAVSLSGPVFAWRIAFRLTGAAPERRYAAYAAGLFAALAVLGMQDVVGRLSYAHYVLSAESDTMIVALCLAAIDLHLASRHRWAFWMWWLASLGRPEVWPFAVLAGAWLWRSSPEYRRWLIASIAAQLFFWFAIPGLTSKSLFTAGNIAQNSPRAVSGNKIAGTISRFHGLAANTVWVAAGLTVAIGALRRNWTILLLSAGATLWLVIEIAFSLGGFPSVPRYMFEAGAVVAVLAGVFVGWLVLELPPLLGGLGRRLGATRLGPRLPAQAGVWGTWLAVLAVGGSMLAPAHRQYQLERLDLAHERARTVLIGRLGNVVRKLGPSHILSCGQPNIPIGYQSVLAWYMGIKIGELYVSQKHERLHPRPLVNIYPIAGLGWKVFPSHMTAAGTRRCRDLTLVYR